MLKFMWLEITGRCNLTCTHCYAGSGPSGSHGSMMLSDWQRVIEGAADLGCRQVQFIGGEPTTHTLLPTLIRFAHQRGLQIEIYSNLVSIKPQLWDVFQECSTHLATSFYTTNPALHEEITQGRHNFEKTVRNIKQAVSLSIPLRVGMVQVKENQNLNEAKKFLTDLGVQRIGSDRARGVGRGSSLVQVTKSREDELCGACARGKAAVMPNGDVYPCVFSRWMRIGNVLEKDFKAIITGKEMAETRTRLTQIFNQRSGDLPTNDCEPYECDPNCEPGECSPDIPPCQPNQLCIPDYKDPCTPEDPCSPDTCNPDACNPNKL